jgi:hypothetical protein
LYSPTLHLLRLLLLLPLALPLAPLRGGDGGLRSRLGLVHRALHLRDGASM